MELLIPEGAEVLASYDHYNWKDYAAITKNHYGEGTAVYIGCMTDKKLLKKILREALSQAGVELPKEHFPVIIRKGTNDFGKTVRFCFNYSDKSQLVKYKSVDGMDLLTDSVVNRNDVISVEPWGVKIIEEK
jgi:beta-galactosidase